MVKDIFTQAVSDLIQNLNADAIVASWVFSRNRGLFTPDARAPHHTHNAAQRWSTSYTLENHYHPGLHTLEIVQSPYETVEFYGPDIESITVPLRQLIYKKRRIEGPSVRMEMERIDPAVIQQQLSLECDSLSCILTQVHLTLETLLIPGETSQFDYLAYLSWPCLRELTLYGVPPITDVSMSRALSNMPSLRTLYLQFYIRSYFPGFFICPPEEEHHPLPPLLTSLTISWPSPVDQVFSQLPPTLRHLSLRDSPRIWGVSRSMGRGLPYLSCQDVLKILGSNDFSALERLEVVYQGSIEEEEMLKFIVASFPSLYFLELHRLRPNRWDRPVYHFRFDGREDSGSEEETPDEDPFELIPIVSAFCFCLSYCS